ncbi:TolB family protein [Wenzhouxiangella marina]|uniref:Uncharacterized protein n=1 Tax=Wenzhouxiangella marina TaxID=1579979 RepID=A0A0K0Y0A0_9GAMM|nr:hypothetical protein [Wenzhouxiangella marina]AKS43291.1 hypothetical protein WM2015_2936 [Wenzhouxiangella marina]MBB6087019.1 Tol biopolymer transport system component [Wenzhouxiangella marina]
MRILPLLLLPAALPFTVLPLTAAAQLVGVTEIQLSTPQHAGSDVQTNSLIFSPDGRYVCFIGDTETEGAGELWCADTDAGAPAIRVSGLLPSGSTVERPAFDDTGSRLFYIAPGADVQKENLFMVPPDGSEPPVRLNAPMTPAGADVISYRYIPETEQIAYTGASQVAGQNELHIVSIDQPGVATILNGPLVSGGDVLSYEVVAAAGRVVYRADQQTDGVDEVYSVLLNGAGAVKLNGPMVAGGSVRQFKVSTDGAWVGYLADEDTDEVTELYISAITGGGSSKVSGPAVAGGDAWHFTFSPDSQWVLFTGDLATNGWRDLYSTPSNGSQPIPNVLATQVVPAPEPPVIEAVPSLPVTADGSYVVFFSDQGNSSSRRVLRAPIDGSSPAVVISGGLTDLDRLEYVPEVDRIVVRNGSGPENLYSIAVDGSSFIPLTSFANAAIDVSGLTTPTGVVYFADPVVDEQASVFFVDYLGQQTQELSSASASFEGLTGSLFIPSDRGAIYFIERHGSVSLILYSFRLKVAELDSLATTELARLGNSFLVAGETTFLSIMASPSNRHQVAYIADKPVDEQADAYLATFSDIVFSDRFEQ